MSYVPEAAAQAEPELLQERYSALQRQTPWLYGILLANVLGLHLTREGDADLLRDPALLLVIAALARLLHWLRARSRRLTTVQIRRELKRTYLAAAIFSSGFCLWAISLFSTGDANQQNHVILFATLAALGCAYGLSSFPNAGKLPLLLLAFPLAVTLIFSGTAVHVGMGTSLILVVFVSLRLLKLQNLNFTQLVCSRSLLEVERARAQEAEAVALAEKRRVKIAADTDPLTQLFNRRAFLDALEEALRTGCSVGVALIDLDGFKPINDTFGHAAGDGVLVEVSRRLTRVASADALAARIGGDEFALLVRNVSSSAALGRVQRAAKALQEAYRSEGREYRLSGCCGLAVGNPAESTASEILKRADLALYEAKQAGPGEVAVFTPFMESKNARRLRLERALRDPLTHADIDLVYQPIFDLGSMQVRSYEALARWEHPELGPISPAEFIPLAEQINVVEEIGYTLLSKAAAEARKWPQHVRLSFNLSGAQLCSFSCSAMLLQILRRERLSSHRVQFEVTETSLLANFEAARANIAVLRNAGARIVLDDFGAGFASISYLRQLEFDIIKLDGSLVTTAPHNPRAMRLLRGVLDLCASLQVPCVAEHVEDQRHLDLLRELNCRFGQGFGLSVPLTAREAELFACKASKAGPASAYPGRFSRAA